MIEDEYQREAEDLAEANQYAAVLMLQHIASIDRLLDVPILKTTSTADGTTPVYE